MEKYMKAHLIALSVCLLNLTLNSSVIEDVVQTSLSTNPHLKQKISEYRSTLYDLDKAKSGYKPILNLNGGIGPEHTDHRAVDPTAKVDLIRKEGSLIMSENLFKGFHTTNNIEEQVFRIQSARFYTLQEANALSLNIVQQYLSLSKQKELLDLEYENLKTHERINKMIHEKMEAGYGKRADLEQSEARLAQASANYIAQLNNYQDALINFERSSGQVVTSVSKLDTPKLPDMSMENLLALATKYNPTILVEHSNISTHKARYKKDKSSFYPTIDAELSGYYKNNIDGYENKDDSYRGMLKLSYNLYNGGFDEATRLQNLQNISSQEYSLNEQERAVTEKLKLAWMSYHFNTNRIRCLKLHRDLSKQTAASYAEEYQLGRRTLLDLLNIELEYTNARKEVATVENELQIASYRILESTGLILYVLHPDFYTLINLEKPQDIVLSGNTTPVSMSKYDVTHNDINITNICTRVYTPVKQNLIAIPEIEAMIKEPAAEPKIVPVSKNFNTKAIIIDETGPGKPVITTTDINFAFNSAVLSKDSRPKIVAIAKKLSEGNDIYIEIHGHTDNIGTDKYNKALSLARAKSAKDVMVRSGSATKRIFIFGHSFQNPVATNTTEEGRQANRRIEFIIKKMSNANK